MSCRVLIVEDNGPFRQALVAALRARFPTVTIVEAADLADGKRSVCQCSPDLVLLDIGLPDGNGLDLAKYLQEECPSATVVVCTSYDLAEYREGARRHGAKHFLNKADLDWDAVGDLVAAEMARAEDAGAGVPAN
ncbi:MAG: response regulator transcription factor [Deltaproteobacteria bacterium]|nr:response regulator transcription factor [Deltaproteobacteria bacterium]